MNKLSIILTATVLAFATTVASATNFYVAPNGNDANSGAKNRPFATLERARDAIRALKQGGPLKEPLTVWLGGGTYALTSEVKFGPEDSGTAACPITYTAAGPVPVVLDGGRRIARWQKHDARLWVTAVPDVSSGAWRFRQLYVNGQQRIRARTPNEGYLRVAGCPEGTPKKVHYHKDYQTFQFKPGVILTDRNVPALSDETYAARVRDMIPLRFFGESEDCVGAALLLCSDAGRYITGVDLLVDGGMSLP